MDTLAFVDDHTCTHTHTHIHLHSQFPTPNTAQLASATMATSREQGSIRVGLGLSIWWELGKERQEE